MKDRIEKLTAEILAKAIEIRHDIHQHPEIAYEEYRTADVIEAFLTEAGIPNERCTDTGVIGMIGSGDGPVVGLRSETDALAMPDLSGLPYASVNEGVAHACGHDGHIAILLGAAWVLKQLEPELKGTVRLVFQPAEEGGAGAAKMLEHGLFDTLKPDAIYSVHGWPGLPVGAAGYRFGPAMAAVDNFEIEVRGKGAHGAMPHSGIDPITIAARVVEGIQLVRSRMINPLDPMVATCGMIHGGSAVNVIPDTVEISGTIRSLSPEVRADIPVLMERMVSETAKASGGSGTFEIVDGYPPTINEDRATAFARDAMIEMLGAENAVEIPDPVMGGEDFSFYLEKIPGSFMRIGVGDRPALHNSSYDFNDDTIQHGIRLMAGIAARFMENGLD